MPVNVLNTDPLWKLAVHVNNEVENGGTIASYQTIRVPDPGFDESFGTFKRKIPLAGVEDNGGDDWSQSMAESKLILSEWLLEASHKAELKGDIKSPGHNALSKSNSMIYVS